MRGQLAAQDARAALEARARERAAAIPARACYSHAFLARRRGRLRAAAAAAAPVSLVSSSTSTASASSTRAAARRPATSRLARVAPRARADARQRRARAPGADEITILMPATDLAGAQALLRRLLRAEPASFPSAGISSLGGPRRTRAGSDARRPARRRGRGLDRARALGGGRAAVRVEAAYETATPRKPPSSRRSRTRCSSATATPASTPRRSSSSRAASPAARPRRARDRAVAAAALLHDIGKVAIPDAVLNKPGA